VSEAEAKRERIKAKVAASQSRLTRDSDEMPIAPHRQNLPDAYPPEDYRSLAAEYPWLTVAAGMGAGLLIGAFLPKGFGAKAGKRVISAAALVGKLGLAYGKQAREAAAELGQDRLAKMEAGVAPFRKHAASAADAARDNARSIGWLLAGEAIRLVIKRRK